jgi:phenylalanyl-tRNA synthetase beta chain
MRLSFDWLSDYVDLSGLTPQEVAEKLTMGAFEVEQVRKVGADIVGPIVVGEIVEINAHPDADRIRLTKIKIDPKSAPVDIVCGAQNIIVGQRVPVALPGARVVNRHTGAELHIQESTIRGATSKGMLCSPPEIGIASAEVDGIYILQGEPEIGADAREMLYLYPDWILDVEPRSNRGDALCIAGMAREVAALCKRELREPKWKLPAESPSEEIRLKIENPEDCPFLSIRVIKDVVIKPSAPKIVKRLEAVGMRAINNVVDATNYVNYELGQPLHAYDLPFIKGGIIEVRRGKKGEVMTTLDEKRQTLSDEVLCIADGKEVVGIAGIMGGKDSEVNDNSNAIALEAAAFSPVIIRRGSRLLGKSSEASLRFERGVDPAGVRKASDRCTYLIVESCGAKVGKLSTAGSDKPKPVSVSLRIPQIKRLGGVDIAADEVVSLLTPLGFKVSKHKGDEVKAEVPSFRQRDVWREIDLIEEVLRLWGFDQIPASLPESSPAPQTPDDTLSIIRNALIACGLSEAITGSLTRREDSAFDSMSAEGDSKNGGGSTVIEVLNPLSEDHQILRQSIIPGLVRAVSYNQDHGRETVWLFETGRGYFKVDKSDDRRTGVHEETLVSGVLCGGLPIVSWRNGDQSLDFFVVKGVVENLCQALKINSANLEFISVEHPASWLHPGQCCQLVVKQKGEAELIGVLGELHPALANSLKLRGPVFIFELSVDKLKTSRGGIDYQVVPTTPSVVRDLTADLALDVRHDAVSNCIKKRAGDNLKSVELINIYKLDEKHRSLTYRLSFQNPEETLTGEEINEKMEVVRKGLVTDFKASFR